MKIKFFKCIYFISIIFIISGAFNYGFSRFVMAIPFSIIASWISLKSLKSPRSFVSVVGLSVMALIVNLTLEKNPLVFPILRKGTITINKDGYLKLFSDGSGGYSPTDKEEINCTGCGEIKYIKISKGETFPIEGIWVGHPDFSTKIDLITPIGRFSERDYLSEMNIVTNKEVKNAVIASISNLMYFPLIIFTLQSELDRQLPGTNVVIIDDSGNLRKGILNRVVTNGRSVNNGDTVRLNCLKAISFQNKKLCDLEFSGFDKNTLYPKDNPLYGKIPSFSVAVDASGNPDKNLLIYK